MDDASVVTLFVFLAGQTVALWRKLEKIDQKLQDAATEQKAQKNRMIKLENDINRIKRFLNLS